MAELLNCKVCSGKVASDAKVCPYCGSQDFKPFLFVEKEKKEREKVLREVRSEYENKFGPVVRISLHGRNLPSNLLISGVSYSDFRIDGKILDREELGHNFRLTPGVHTVTLEYRCRDFIDKETSLTFTTKLETREIMIFYSYKKPGFFSHMHYNLDKVEVISK